jgi:hypothetical protein
MRVARPMPNTLDPLQHFHQTLQCGRIKTGFDYDPSPTRHDHAETTITRGYRIALLRGQFHRHQPSRAGVAGWSQPPEVTTEGTQCQTLAPAKLDLSEVAAHKFADDLLNLGRRTPPSPAHHFLFFDHGIYVNTEHAR